MLRETDFWSVVSNKWPEEVVEKCVFRSRHVVNPYLLDSQNITMAVRHS